MENEKNKVGRPKGMTAEKAAVKEEYKEILKTLKKNKVHNQDAIALNEIKYNVNKYGLLPFLKVREDFNNPVVTTGFEMLVANLFKKSYEGSLPALELILKIVGGAQTKIDHTSSDGSMSPKGFVQNISTSKLEKLEQILSEPEEDSE